MTSKEVMKKRNICLKR